MKLSSETECIGTRRETPVYKCGGPPNQTSSDFMFLFSILLQIQMLSVALAALTYTASYVFLCPTTTSTLTQLYFGPCGATSTALSTAPQDKVTLVTPVTNFLTVLWDLSTPSSSVTTLLRSTTAQRFTMIDNGVDCNENGSMTWFRLNYYCWLTPDVFILTDVYSTVFIPSSIPTSTVTDTVSTTATETVTVASTSTVLASFCQGSDGIPTRYTTGPVPGTSTVTVCHSNA